MFYRFPLFCNPLFASAILSNYCVLSIPVFSNPMIRRDWFSKSQSATSSDKFRYSSDRLLQHVCNTNEHKWGPCRMPLLISIHFLGRCLAENKSILSHINHLSSKPRASIIANRASHETVSKALLKSSFKIIVFLFLFL